MIDAKKRIVITGLGIVSPIGIGKDIFWKNACAGKHGFKELGFSAEENKPQYLGGVIEEFVPKEYVTQRKLLKIMSRPMQTAVAATTLALEDAKLVLESYDPTRVGVSIGTGMIHTDINELGEPIIAASREKGFALDTFAATAMERLFPLWLLKQLPNLVASHISILFNAQGASNTITSGAGAGIQAIEEAVYNIQNDICDIYICGGADYRTHPLDILKYQLYGLIPENGETIEEVFRPYSADRSGFIPGEAAVIFAIESEEHAKKRGAHIYGTVLGCGSSAGVSYREKDFERRLNVQSNAIQQAFRNSGEQFNKIDYICGHGCGSVIDDAVEIAAYRNTFANSFESIPLSSPSSMIGYVGATTGPLNLACTLMAMQDGIVTPTLFLTHPDKQCSAYHVTGSACERQVDTALVNAFDFYGQSASMIVSKYKE
ncbi:beta-ketoacyl-[acyl-carrier-protein] synthase family protein [bacterium]|nr:beta-ketoacyl-[acyl-carrier-protein] synthase family protein [bacterium]